MANRSERLRKAYEFKLGKDVTSKLFDEQILLISSYYKSLSKDEQSKIDIDIFMGKTNDLSEMATSFIEENEESPVERKKVTATATKGPQKGEALVPVGKSGEDLVNEKIDERILRIIGLDDVFDIDYDTYISLLKEQSVLISTGKSKIPREEEILIQDEFKRVKKRKGKGRFKVSKITAESFKKGTAVGLNIQKLSQEVKSSPLMLSPAMESVKKINQIDEIKDALKETIGYLTQQNKDAKKKSDLDRRSAENRKRAKKESELEKGFGKVMKIAEKILAPVKSILKKIIDFITIVFFGRALIKLIDWLADPANKNKFDSILRFLGDQWPALLALYLRFGTGLGKFVGAISNIVIKGGIKLAALAAQLLVKAGVGKAAGAAKFLGGERGRLLGAGLQVAATVGSTLALSSGIENFGGIGNDEKQEPSKVEGRVGGGVIKIPKFMGGGFNFGGFGNFFNGLVSGQKGVDKIPAMLSDGEFVMSAGAVRKHGVDTLEAMNAAGGGTNKPKMVTGIPQAAGGGYIGDYMSGQVKLRPATTFEMSGSSHTLKNLLGVRTNEEAARIVSSAGNKVPDLEDLLGRKEYLRLQQGHINTFSEGADEQTFKGLRRIYQQHFGVGKEFSKMMSDRVDSKMLRRSSKPKPTSTPRPKPKVTRINPTKMLPAAGQSSANAMRAVRAPIPASSAIVPYTGGGALARQGGGALATNPLTNMNVPGGRGIGKGGLAGTIVMTLVEMFRPQIQEAVGNVSNKLGIGMGNLSDKDLKKEIMEEMKITKSISSQFGGDLINSAAGDDRLRLLQKELDKRNLNRGGAIKGGFGLKDQSFKDMPKTQIMSDDRGRPFIGYKSMRGGKPVYVRGPQPVEGTSNPLEMMGRMINPGAYKDVDALSQQKKYQQASAGSISSLKARGASQLTLANRQSQLKKSIPAVSSKSKTKVVYVTASNTKTKPNISSGGGTPKVPSFSVSHPSGHSQVTKVLGIK